MSLFQYYFSSGIVVRRDYLIQGSLVHFKDPSVLESSLKITYHGEIGYDAG